MLLCHLANSLATLAFEAAQSSVLSAYDRRCAKELTACLHLCTHCYGHPQGATYEKVQSGDTLKFCSGLR